MAGFMKMSKMDKFVRALETAMRLSKDIPGIKDIKFTLSYTGSKSTVAELIGKVNDMMAEVNKVEEPAKEEEIITVEG